MTNEEAMRANGELGAYAARMITVVIRELSKKDLLPPVTTEQALALLNMAAAASHADAQASFSSLAGTLQGQNPTIR